jgi:meso-butanediol dehydrogenase/(S,S)-butanediol dehydrogenase/diacetyl reductase
MVRRSRWTADISPCEAETQPYFASAIEVTLGDNVEKSKVRMSEGPVTGRLANKVVVVTGAGRGQGRDVALLFARAGATVVASDINPASIEETRVIASREGLTLEVAVVDAADDHSVRSWVDDAARRFRDIDVLYNNAAYTHFAPFGEMTLEQWRETLRLELDVVFIPTQAVWRHMLAQGGGSIINVASTSGMRGSALLGAAAHAAGKSGVIGFTRQLAAEGAAHWIRVNSISPGPIVTPVTQGMMEGNQQFADAFEAWPLLGRSGRSSDIAYAALFLASDESAWITGSNLVVDGGVSCKAGFKEVP